MKKLFAILLTLSMIFALAACGGSNEPAPAAPSTPAPAASNTPAPAAPAAPAGTDDPYAELGDFVIALGSSVSDITPEGKYNATLKQLVEERTNGHVEIQLYLAAQMGSDREIIESTQFGSLGIGSTGVTAWTNIVKELNVLDEPFALTTRDDVYAMLHDQEFHDYLGKVFESYGYHYLDGHFIGFRQLTSNRLIEKVEDFKGLNIRVIETSTPLALWNSFKCNPTPIAFTEVYTALQQGTVEAQENPITNIYDKKFFEQQKYIILTNHQMHPVFWTMNLNLWNSLPVEYQEIFTEASKEAMEAAHAYAESEESKMLQEMVDFGCEVITPSDEFIAEMVEKTQHVRDDINAQYPEMAEAFNACIDRIK